MGDHSRSPIAEFAASVKVGDTVGVYDWIDQRKGMIFAQEVVKITPTGRIKLSGGSVFKPDGFKYADKVYGSRYIWKVGEKS